MSYDLGHSRGYIYNISSGKSLPPLSELFAICDYFGITLAGFFDDSISNPELIRKAVEGMKQLDDSDQLMILNHINRLLKNERESSNSLAFLKTGGLIWDMMQLIIYPLIYLFLKSED